MSKFEEWVKQTKAVNVSKADGVTMYTHTGSDFLDASDAWQAALSDPTEEEIEQVGHAIAKSITLTRLWDRDGAPYAPEAREAIKALLEARR